MKKLLIFFFVFVTATLGFTQEFKVKPYQPSDAEQALSDAIDTTSIYADRLVLARQFRDNYPDDAGVQSRVTDLLAVDDADAVRKFYKDRAKQNSDNIIAQYLAGRIAELVGDRKEYAKKIFGLDPDSYWGYLVQATAYFPDEDTEFTNAEAALRAGIKADNSKPYALEMLGEILRNTDRASEADYVYQQLSKMLPNDFDPVQKRMMLIPGQFKEHLELIDDYLKRQPKDALALDVRARIYRELGDWDGYIESMRRAVEAEPDGVNYYNLACGLALAGQTDSAFARLYNATDAGFSDVDVYEDDDDLLPLHDDERWIKLLSRVEKNNVRSLQKLAEQQTKELTEKRRERAVERTHDKTAPEFTAKTFDGKEVSLSDLRGKIVVIDFWATWCGPCRRTMPLLDKFYKEVRDADVEVFGVNVWERGGTGKVKPYIDKQGYTFPVLLAENSVAERYGVRGIPTMFVIDKKGRIAYKHVGYNPKIVQILTAQVEELSKTDDDE